MNQYKPGDWNLICDVCGTKIKASESKRRWDGLLVCKRDFEFRHPQDFLRAKTDKISVPFSRSEPADKFGSGVVDGNGNIVNQECNLAALALADISQADVALADIDTCEELNGLLNPPTDPISRSAIAGYAVAGVSITGTAFLGSL